VGASFEHAASVKTRTERPTLPARPWFKRSGCRRSMGVLLVPKGWGIFPTFAGDAWNDAGTLESRSSRSRSTESPSDPRFFFLTWPASSGQMRLPGTAIPTMRPYVSPESKDCWRIGVFRFCPCEPNGFDDMHLPYKVACSSGIAVPQGKGNWSSESRIRQYVPRAGSSGPSVRD
jgi:hypothetical protein